MPENDEGPDVVVDDDDDPHYFQFDLDIAILDQVKHALSQSPALPLAKGVGPRESGRCALYDSGQLV
jgi:hypothetical protein